MSMLGESGSLEAILNAALLLPDEAGEKATLTAHVPDGLITCATHVLPWMENCAPSVPTTVAALTARSAMPVFETVNVCA
jgi:hypothetical protein